MTVLSFVPCAVVNGFGSECTVILPLLISADRRRFATSEGRVEVPDGEVWACFGFDEFFHFAIIPDAPFFQRRREAVTVKGLGRGLTERARCSDHCVFGRGIFTLFAPLGFFFTCAHTHTRRLQG